MRRFVSCRLRHVSHRTQFHAPFERFSPLVHRRHDDGKRGTGHVRVAGRSEAKRSEARDAIAQKHTPPARMRRTARKCFEAVEVEPLLADAHMNPRRSSGLHSQCARQLAQGARHRPLMSIYPVRRLWQAASWNGHSHDVSADKLSSGLSNACPHAQSCACESVDMGRRRTNLKTWYRAPADVDNIFPCDPHRDSQSSPSSCGENVKASQPYF